MLKNLKVRDGQVVAPWCRENQKFQKNRKKLKRIFDFLIKRAFVGGAGQLYKRS